MAKDAAAKSLKVRERIDNEEEKIGPLPKARAEDAAIRRGFVKGTMAKADAAFADFFFAEPLNPASIWESPYFKAMMKAVTAVPSSYKGPHRHRVYGEMLE